AGADRPRPVLCHAVAHGGVGLIGAGGLGASTSPESAEVTVSGDGGRCSVPVVWPCLSALEPRESKTRMRGCSHREGGKGHGGRQRNREPAKQERGQRFWLARREPGQRLWLVRREQRQRLWLIRREQRQRF